nr:EAL domain-containing protein [Motilibacter deserti]
MDQPWIVAALVVAFICTELGQLHIIVGKQTRSIHFSELPGVVALFLVGPLGFLISHVLATAAVVLKNRTPATKAAFNLALSANECLVLVVVLEYLGDGAELTLASALAVFVGVFAVNTLDLTALRTVIWLTEGHPPSRQRSDWVAAVLGVGGVFSAALGLVVVALVQTGSWQWLLLLPLAGVLYAAYRTYSTLLERHLALERLYDFSQTTRNGSRWGDVVPELLEQARSLLNAERAVIRVHGRPGAEDAVIAVADSSGFDGGDAPGERPVGLALHEEQEAPEDAGRPPAAMHDEIHEEVLHSRKPLLVARGTTDARLREWLAARDARDAMVVPLVGDTGAFGTLEVAGHQADSRTFTPADLRLLETLATHTGFALENSQLLDRLRHDAHHDHLTGLANRGYFMERLDEAVAAHRPFAVMIMDLDRFKDINDALGHHSGDQLLRAVASRLLLAAPEGATVARLGGDEFAVLLPDTGAREDAEQAARAISEALMGPVPLEDASIDVEGSVGIALHPEHGTDAAALLQHADIAMYAAKTQALGVRAYDPTLDEGGPRRLALMAELRSALRADEIVVFYQPKVRLSDAELVGVEALARWQHPTRGLVPPDEFIPLAEHTGVIGPLTLRVLETSLAQCRQWLEEGKSIPVAVNISVRALLDPAFPAQVVRVLAAQGVPPALLTLELTETSIMSDRARAVPALEQLTGHGVKVSVDDFGTGYSSLAHLRRLPVTEVKIDKSFVFGMATEPEDAAIVEAIVQLAHFMGKQVVAEGVEDALSWHKLTAMGCDIAQGYLMSRPLPPDRLETWLRDNALPPRPGVNEPASVRRKARPLRLATQT